MARISQPRPGPANTLDLYLAEDRLRRRERRLKLALDALRTRARATPSQDAVPSGLGHAIDDFSRQLDAVRHELSHRPHHPRLPADSR